MMRRTGGKRHRGRRSAAHRQELIERFEGAGQSRGRFCAVHGLALSTCDLSRRKLRATGAADKEHLEALPSLPVSLRLRLPLKLVEGDGGE